MPALTILMNLAVDAGRCPIDRKPREARPLSDFQRLRWWCPMHPSVTADQPGAVCKACGGMVLKPRVISYTPAGQVLTVPASAVVDAGARKVVFVESMPGMFDGVEVVLGPRCGDLYPVVRGLEAGQRVAFAGAFLLDAETRLNPSLAAGYFGAGRGERAAAPGPLASATKPATPATAAAFQELAPEDRLLAERQKLCPVTNKPLGSMGTPAAQSSSPARSSSSAATAAKVRSSETRPNTWRSCLAIDYRGAGILPRHRRPAH